MNMRMILAFAGFMAVAAVTPAAATSPREMLDLLAKCAEITDAPRRLACYDQLAPQLRDVQVMSFGIRCLCAVAIKLPLHRQVTASERGSSNSRRPGQIGR